MDKYGSAVLTALQARYMTFEEIAYAAPHRCFKSFLQGGKPDKWWAEFWRTYALLKEQEALVKCKNNLVLKVPGERK